MCVCVCMCACVCVHECVRVFVFEINLQSVSEQEQARNGERGWERKSVSEKDRRREKESTHRTTVLWHI